MLTSALAAARVADVVVVGAGVVGSAFALKLAESLPGRRILVVDGGARPPPLQAVASLPTPDLRTFAITPASSAFFGSSWDRMLAARAQPFTNMQVCSPAEG